MDVGLLNVSLLFGLGAVLIPPLLHLLRRRRDEVVDWGAMQFLPSSQAQRRRRLLDELLLLLLRMGVVALLVLALASPYAVSPWLAGLGDGPSRDVVLVIDGSYSMARRGAPTPGEAARHWAEDFVASLGRGDRAAVVLTRQPPVLWQELLTADRRLLAARLAELPAPCGNPDLPRAVGQAWDLLRSQGRAATLQIVVLTDRQRHGWTDPETRRQWDALAERWQPEMARLRGRGEPVPALCVVDVGAAAEAPQGNFALAPLLAGRGLALTGQQVTFRSALQRDGFAAPGQPPRVYYEIDGKTGGEVALPAPLSISEGRIPLTFRHRFDAPGPHLVTLKLEAQGDCLAADNEQHVVVEVLEELPLLLIDGDPKVAAESSTFFLQRALARPGVARPPRAIAAVDVAERDLSGSAVVVLADVPRLADAQAAALERYVGEGGSVLVVLGERVEKDYYNRQLYREGDGWLPARLDEVAKGTEPARPELKTFTHPAVALLAHDAQGGLGQVRFPRWWKVSSPSRAPASPMGLLSSGDAMLLEKPYKKGRVILCTVPLDRRWDSTLPSTWEYPVLVHELVYYLAGLRADGYRLAPGAPLRFQPRAVSAELVLTAPGQPEQTFHVKNWPWIHEDTGAIGVYRVRCGAEMAYFVQPPDLRESDLHPASEEELRQLAEGLPIPVQWEQRDEADLLARPRQELWWLLLLGVIALLCGEVWMTRRLLARQGAS